MSATFYFWEKLNASWKISCKKAWCFSSFWSIF